MEFLAAFFALFLLLMKPAGFLFAAFFVAVGYWLRKYVHKHWPKEQDILDAAAKRYGVEIKAKLKEYERKLGARELG